MQVLLIFGALVPQHVVVVINSALSEHRCTEGRLTEGMSPAFFYDGMSAHARPFLGTSEQSPAEETLQRRVAAVWDALREDPAARY